MWRLNDIGRNAILSSLTRRIKHGMKPAAWLEDAEEEANRAWEDPEWIHREAEIEVLSLYCIDNKAHTLPLFVSWFDWKGPRPVHDREQPDEQNIDANIVALQGNGVSE